MVVFCLLAAVQLALGVGLEHILHSAWADCVLTVRHKCLTQGRRCAEDAGACLWTFYRLMSW
jgi:hypothetical protein